MLLCNGIYNDFPKVEIVHLKYSSRVGLTVLSTMN